LLTSFGNGKSLLGQLAFTGQITGMIMTKRSTGNRGFWGWLAGGWA
jgi:hypothetical protein